MEWLKKIIIHKTEKTNDESENLLYYIDLLKEKIKNCKIKEKKIKNKELSKNIKLLVLLIESATENKYKELTSNLIKTLSVILYFINPIDIVPDFIPFIGYLDDIFLINYFLINNKDIIVNYKNHIKKENIKSKGLDVKDLKSIGCFIGLACGDALGVTLEFSKRDFNKVHDDIIGGGYFRLNAGNWSDDTSMALCLANSLINDGFNLKEQLKNYQLWIEYGHFSSIKKSFGIGGTVAHSLVDFIKNGTIYTKQTDPNTAGNGSIMRLAPIPIYFRGQGMESVMNYSMESSKTTHGALECIETCAYLGLIIFSCIEENEPTKEFVLFNEKQKKLLLSVVKEKKVIDIINGSWINLKYEELPNTPYVIDTIISALWCFYNTNSFKDAIVKAVNLGGDADTIGAVTGQIAGAYYGLNNIPQKWIDIITHSKQLQDIAYDLNYVNKNI